MVGRKIGYKSRTKVFANDKIGVNISKFLLLGFVGTVIFVWDYIRLNGITETKADTSSGISLIGSLGSMLTPILLLLGVYYNAKTIRKKGSFSLFGSFLVFCYSVPCMISAGRESILFGLIGIICVYGYNRILQEQSKKKRHFKNKQIFQEVCPSFLFSDNSNFSWVYHVANFHEPFYKYRD